MKKYFLFLLIILPAVCWAFSVNAEVSNNSGFIPGQIWYSKETLTEEETVNIHTAVWNGEKNSLSTKVEFYDKNVILGSRDVIIAPLELKDVYIPWKITSGDHVISAKIISSTLTISDKKEKVVLDRIATSNDRQFVSVVVKNEAGKIVSGDNLLQTQIDKTSSKINSIVPEKVRTSISNIFTLVDNFRDKIFTKVTIIKDKTQKEIDLLKNKDKTVEETLTGKSNIEDATNGQITHIKLFLLSVLVFIFGNKIVFYGLLILIVFYILRGIYRTIRNR